jgi:hypothetical protein
MVRSAALFFCLLLVIGCDTGERMTRLEKQTADLKADVEKDRSVRDLDLQAKCAKDARAWFNENWSSSRDKDTVLLDFTNHYNVKLNKCFILVEFHYKSHFADAGGDSWTNNIELTDVYENNQYGRFAENHYTYLKPQFRTEREVINCDAKDGECKTLDDFQNLTRPYMNN